MLNHSDIMSTVDMIDHQHLDIRTITMGISLLDCADPDPAACARKIHDKICRQAEHLVATGCQIERELGLRPEQLVVIDDLKPGRDMAERAGVDFIAAGWTHTVPHIIETMQRISPHYCRTVAELAALLLDA